ncbi:PP2C family protein-serine/threonine phosphatase [Streptantibioticus rubrisoli]|uniref:Serine/threonine-protein phosphatase n=1 Tax=Streptantibioticus rubrisoli TaxID=1387313 RepID=A0ABT1P6V9_9ACTN|nr:PP2C family protein-serine/threonine phosphatase [Streptantibioticus rubrisoli]MCQ4041090.1 serine/threonine-protein phosphatase [Streptantibioticus rubrisoli]
MDAVTDAERRTTAEAVLRAAAPHALIPAAQGLLADRAGARSVTLLMADYGSAVLQPVPQPPEGAEQLPAHHGPPGRAFSAQTPVVEGTDDPAVVLAHLPVTVRGDRLGVLRVELPRANADAAALAELAEFATALGHELLTADRDTDLYLRARRRKRLTLAAEMQWQLLPGRGCARDEYVLGAHLEPAYAIGGDNFDWSTSADHLIVTLTDGMGQGMDASLLTSLTVNALRNARRAGVGLADQASLADQAVYAQYRGLAYASTVLLRFDLDTGLVHAVDAGSPRVFRQRGASVELVELEGQLPLGMFEETQYEEQTFHVVPGDRLVIVSTGVHGARSAEGVLYGERALSRSISASRLATPHETARAVVHGLVEHFGSDDLVADAAVICLDWKGRVSTQRTDPRPSSVST